VLASAADQQVRTKIIVKRGSQIMKLLRAISSMCLVAAACVGGTAAAKDRDVALVLGDSVAFAYINSAGHEYINPDNFLGFADDLGATLGLESVDAGCPGEATGSFLSSTGADNGCRAFRAKFPLHVAYGGTQLEFAQKYLERHRDVRLVTITLGANDGFILENACFLQPDPAACIQAGLPSVLATVERNLQTILADLRATGFGGAIVITNYYSLDYSDAAGTGLTALLNAALEAPAAAYGAVVADVFTAFKTVAAGPIFGGKTCNTGLLNPGVPNPLSCDVHPSQSGHRLIAQAIARTVRAIDD
jgi:lysophospholipase L1-like esterase